MKFVWQIVEIMHNTTAQLFKIAYLNGNYHNGGLRGGSRELNEATFLW